MLPTRYVNVYLVSVSWERPTESSTLTTTWAWYWLLRWTWQNTRSPFVDLGGIALQLADPTFRWHSLDGEESSCHDARRRCLARGRFGRALFEERAGIFSPEGLLTGIADHGEQP